MEVILLSDKFFPSINYLFLFTRSLTPSLLYLTLFNPIRSYPLLYPKSSWMRREIISSAGIWFHPFGFATSEFGWIPTEGGKQGDRCNSRSSYPQSSFPMIIGSELKEMNSFIFLIVGEELWRVERRILEKGRETILLLISIHILYSRPSFVFDILAF